MILKKIIAEFSLTETCELLAARYRHSTPAILDTSMSSVLTKISDYDRSTAKLTRRFVAYSAKDLFPAFLGVSSLLSRDHVSILEKVSRLTFSESEQPVIDSLLQKGTPLNAYLYCPIDGQYNTNMAAVLPEAIQWLMDNHFVKSLQDPFLKKFLDYGFHHLVAKTYRQENASHLKLALINVFLLFLHDDLRDDQQSVVGKDSVAVSHMNDVLRTIFSIVENLDPEDIDLLEATQHSRIKDAIAPLIKKYSDIMRSLSPNSGVDEKEFETRVEFEIKYVGLICNAYLDFALRLRKETSKELFEEYRESMDGYFEANAWEATNRQGSIVPDLMTYQYRRTHTSAVEPVFRIANILRGHLSPRNLLDGLLTSEVDRIQKANLNTTLNLLNSQAIDHIVFVNDVASYRREEKDGVVENLIVVYRAQEKDLGDDRESLLDAVQFAVDLTNATMAEFVKSATVARAIVHTLFQESKLSSEQVDGIESYIQVREDWARGNLGWSVGDNDTSPTLRYGVERFAPL